MKFVRERRTFFDASEGKESRRLVQRFFDLMIDECIQARELKYRIWINKLRILSGHFICLYNRWKDSPTFSITSFSIDPLMIMNFPFLMFFFHRIIFFSPQKTHTSIVHIQWLMNCLSFFKLYKTDVLRLLHDHFLQWWLIRILSCIFSFCFSF